MFAAMFGSVEQGIIYAIMALGVYISFRVLDFPDLTVDGSFVTGAAVAATMVVLGYNPIIATDPIIATVMALIVGFLSWMCDRAFTYKGKNKCPTFRYINDDRSLLY